MATNYPGSLDDFATTSPAKLSDDDSTGRTHAERHNDVESAVEAIQGELGTDPAGAQATVKARLDNLTIFAQQHALWPSGAWLGNAVTHVASTAIVTTSADVLYLVPVWVPFSVTLDRIAIAVGAGASGANCRIGIYGSDSDGLPTGTATDLGEVDASSMGSKALTISQAVTGGTSMWVGILNENGSVQLEGFASESRPARSVQTPTALTISHYRQTGATYTSGLPTIGSLTAATGSVPWVGMRRS